MAGPGRGRIRQSGMSADPEGCPLRHSFCQRMEGGTGGGRSVCGMEGRSGFRRLPTRDLSPSQIALPCPPAGEVCVQAGDAAGSYPGREAGLRHHGGRHWRDSCSWRSRIVREFVCEGRGSQYPGRRVVDGDPVRRRAGAARGLRRIYRKGRKGRQQQLAGVTPGGRYGGGAAL